MRPTRLGWGAAAMLVLTLAAAASSGNNLLHLIFGSLVAAFLLSVAVGRWNLASAAAEVDAPDQIFRGAEFPLTVRLGGTGAAGAAAVRVLCRGETGFVDRLSPGEGASLEFRYRCAHRGVNSLEDIVLASSFPFGLLEHRRRVPPRTLVVLPGLREVHGPAEIDSMVEVSGKAVTRRGRSGDLYGIREHRPGEDASAINWKLTAKTGKPLVLEYAESAGAKVVVRLEGLGRGAEAERRIDEAASACRYYIDAGHEVRLATPEAEVDYGKGLLHLDLLLRTLALAGEGRLPRPSGPAVETPAAPAPEDAARRRLLLLAAAAVYGSLFLIEEIPPAMLWAASLLLPLGWLLQERGVDALPPLVWNLASLGVLLFVVLVDWRASGIVLANTHLILYLLANRLLHPLRSSDFNEFFLILFLGFFLVSGQTISLWYFVFFLLFLGLSGLWLATAAGLRPAQWRRWAPAVGAVVLACLALTGAVFAATPRFDARYRGNPLAAAMGLDKLRAESSPIMGFTENVSLGFFGRLKKSSARVMRVKPEAVPASGIAPPPLHIRGAAFDRFDGRRWTRSAAEFRYRLNRRGYSSKRGLAWLPQGGAVLRFPSAPGRSESALNFSIYPMNASVIFSAGGLSTLRGKDLFASFDFTDSAYFYAPYSEGVQYRLTGDPEAIGFGSAVEGYDALVRARFLQIPDAVGPRVRDLASRIVAGRTGDRERAMAVQAYLRRSYDYSTYSADAGTTLEDFLFKVRSGNCEYFATAGAILLRGVGIPSRLVTGFLADDWNEYGFFYDVRQSHAHAWVEAYVDGRWRTMDPTPGEGRFPYSVRSVAARMSRWFDAVQLQWYVRVIGYDSYTQRNTFHRIGFGVSRRDVRRAALAALAPLAAAAALWTALAAVRSRRRVRRASGFYGAAQAALERAGLKRAPHWTPREYADWVVSRRPALAAVAALAELHYVERFSPRALNPEEAARARRLLGELRSQL